MEINVKITGAESIVNSISELQKPALEAAGAGMHNCLLEHFRARQSEPRADGFSPVGFWFGNGGNSVAERTMPPVIDGNTAMVIINSPALAHKLDSAPPPITPKGGRKYLAIPATDAASQFPGMPRDFAGTHFAFLPHPGGGNRPALADASDIPVYWLIRRAQTRHDPRALPSEQDLSTAATDAIADALA